MFFGKKNKDSKDYEDPATRYGRVLRSKKGRRDDYRDKPSLLARIFGSGHDSDFVYHDD
jgi:hypothetical protein